ncbi:MAG: YjbQ family protein [Archaeoglobus sp.]|uniref:secondary thiamine-phosphate synthase enzyme YjbQ n=1 Tax=Archaeoglobus sp. TaxID=1872626 RepID=UPI001D4353A7|nr:secondary thiamine-phosphate synthase enzyme YjbQ [Archaeoglobus sp.]MBO8179521.1 YjbQ family protein [Archaeoglobus sp.]
MEITLKTTRRVEIIDITKEVEKCIEGGDLAVVYTPHTTTSLVINEGESGLLEDILQLMEKLVPFGKGYKHDRIDSNADAHLKATILGNSAVIPIENGRLALGTWQKILFVEFDGPRTRRVVVKTI